MELPNEAHIQNALPDVSASYKLALLDYGKHDGK